MPPETKERGLVFSVRLIRRAARNTPVEIASREALPVAGAGEEAASLFITRGRGSLQERAALRSLQRPCAPLPQRTGSEPTVKYLISLCWLLRDVTGSCANRAPGGE